jgi:ferredoxin
MRLEPNLGKGALNEVEYRGIKLAESVKLYKKNREYNKAIKKALDTLADALNKRDFKLIGFYIGTNTKVELQCNKGHLISIIPKDFKRGNGCKKCSGNCPEEAKKKFHSLLKVNGHKALTDYVNSSTKILIDFKCGHEPHSLIPSDYRNGVGCAVCGGTNSKQAGKELIELVEANGHKLLSPYIRNQEKVLIDYNCGHEPQWIRPLSYKSGHRCRSCGGTSPELAKKEFLEMLQNNNHKLVSEYKNNSEKVKIDYNCGHEPHSTTPHNYKAGMKCPKCTGQCPEQAEKELIKMIKKNKHILLSKYKGSKEKVLIDFDCEHGPHLISPNHYRKGQGCPKCKQSKGTKAICNWLDTNKIEYETEYKLPNKNWRYDIFIPSENLIVEIHGAQHFRNNGYFKRTVAEQAKRDQDKWAYANSLGYEYLEIDYKEHKPELALERFIKKFNAIRSKSLIEV